MAHPVESGSSAGGHGCRVLPGAAVRHPGAAQGADRSVSAGRQAHHHPAGGRLHHHDQARRRDRRRSGVASHLCAGVEVPLAGALHPREALHRPGAACRAGPVPGRRVDGVHLGAARGIPDPVWVPVRVPGVDDHRRRLLRLRHAAHPGLRVDVPAAARNGAPIGAGSGAAADVRQASAPGARVRRGDGCAAHAARRLLDVDDDCAAPAPLRGRDPHREADRQAAHARHHRGCDNRARVVGGAAG